MLSNWRSLRSGRSDNQIRIAGGQRCMPFRSSVVRGTCQVLLLILPRMAPNHSPTIGRAPSRVQDRVAKNTSSTLRDDGISSRRWRYGGVCYSVRSTAHSPATSRAGSREVNGLRHRCYRLHCRTNNRTAFTGGAHGACYVQVRCCGSVW